MTIAIRVPWAAVALLLPAWSVHADSIVLRSSVRLEASAEVVRLGDVAALEGPEANALADLVVARRPDAGAVLEIPLEEIRARLDDTDVHWGRVHLTGRRVVVRPGLPAESGRPAAMTAVEVREPVTRPSPRRAPERLAATECVDARTLRGAITRLICGGARVAPEDLQLAFGAADRPLLDQSIDTTRFEIDPLGSYRSDRIHLQVRVWSEGRPETPRQLTVKPWLRVQTVSPLVALRKDDPLAEAELAVEMQWLPPSQAALCAGLAEAVGRHAAQRLSPGEILRQRHIRQEILIERGNPVIVRCLVGGVAITLMAQARADGSIGDVIELRKPGEHDLTATVTGRGEAVLDLGH